MVSVKMLNVVDKVYQIFIFNPDTVRGAKEFISGHYEWSWIWFMLAAVLIWNVKFWTSFRDEREKLPKTILRAAAEGIVHWCLSNAFMFLAMEANRLIYDVFTDYVPEEACIGSCKTDGIRGLLYKMHLVDNRTVLVPRVRNPSVPFALMLTTSLIVSFLAYLTKNGRAQTLATD
uniref:2-aminophenol 1,6-dioxygenase alpha subunit n=1 Tax=Lygus hesperus TaxID=30085 RepID=A0A0A9X7C1_LYGHE